MKFVTGRSALPFFIIYALVAGASCSSASDDEPGLDEDLGVTKSELRKGAPGAVIGHSNYCDDPLNPCAAGEGDCDGSAGCEPGLVCGRGKLMQFGFSGGDACIAAHCANKVLDAGETQIDCGGECGTVCATPVCSTGGVQDRCNADCLCSVGEGDCDSDLECDPGLVCGHGKGVQFGISGGACVAAHCTNKVMDGGETRIDCGGPCGTICSTGTVGPVLLGASGNYVILAESAISTVPTSAITGHVGLSPAAASFITGFGLTRVGTYWTSPQVTGKIFAADNDPPTPSNLTTAVGAMHAAYTDAAGRSTPDFLNLAAGAIGGLTLTPGLYKWTSTVTVPDNVTLSGGSTDVWIFQISGDLEMSANKAMTLAGQARAKNIFWQVAGTVALGSGAHAEGVVLSKTAITFDAGASINGRLLAQTAVNLKSSTVVAPAP